MVMNELENKLKNHIAARLLNIESRIAEVYDSGKPFFDYSKPLEDQWIEKELFEVIKLYFDERDKIVHCRDCEHYRDHELFPIEDAPDICIRIPYGIKIEPDGFCKWGKRREK